MRKFESIIFAWIKTFKEIFKSALVYLWRMNNPSPAKKYREVIYFGRTVI